MPPDTPAFSASAIIALPKTFLQVRPDARTAQPVAWLPVCCQYGWGVVAFPLSPACALPIRLIFVYRLAAALPLSLSTRAIVVLNARFSVLHCWNGRRVFAFFATLCFLTLARLRAVESHSKNARAVAAWLYDLNVCCGLLQVQLRSARSLA